MELNVKIIYDPSKVSETQITDSMNEWRKVITMDELTLKSMYNVLHSRIETAHMEVERAMRTGESKEQWYQQGIADAFAEIQSWIKQAATDKKAAI